MEEPTRPSPQSAHARAPAAAREWCLTLAFHPDAGRIGEQRCLPLRRRAWSLGRAEPDFSVPFPLPDEASPTGTPAPRGLADLRVSRRALTLAPVAQGWMLRRDAGSSPLRLDGADVGVEVFLSEQRLLRGVVLTLAHSVVLHLALREALDARTRDARPPRGLLGVSAALRHSFAAIHSAAGSDDDVLLLGPTGVGKDVAARAIHAGSARRERPLVAVNMAALAPELAAAALFGATRGAYTGADRHRPGYFQRAAGGTLFLDEVGDTPPALQAMLLRALQDRELQVVGGAVETVDLRVVAATEFDLDAPASSFRSALRYRLAAREIRLPTLAERREDIGLIAAAACGAGARHWSPADGDAARLARWAAAFEGLLLRHWPGNVRELLHCVRGMLDSDGQLPPTPAGAGEVPLAIAEADSAAVAAAAPEAPATSLRDLGDSDFLGAWEANGFEVARVARQYGVSRQAVYRRVQRLAQCRLAADVPLRELLDTLRACRGDLAATASRLAVSAAGLKQRLRSLPVEGAAAPRPPAPRGGAPGG